MKPVIALVGRPNVGKSTLFNRLTRSRDAIVHDAPGVTRDRHYGEGRAGGKAFIAIDTGGLEPTSPQGVFVEMARQAAQAIAESDAVVFVVDARAGLTPADRAIAQRLRESRVAVTVAVNKSEGMAPESAAAEFHELGLGAPAAISASHGEGIKAMMDGEGDVVSGWHNKLQSAIANVTPASVLANMHRKQAAPGSGDAR